MNGDTISLHTNVVTFYFGGGSSIGKYGSYADTGRQTRSQQLAQMGALDPLMASAKSPEAGGAGKG